MNLGQSETCPSNTDYAKDIPEVEQGQGPDPGATSGDGQFDQQGPSP